MALDALKRRWRERSAKYHAKYIAEMEEKKEKEEKEKLRISKLREIQAMKIAQRHLEVETVERNYMYMQCEEDSSDTSPLLLDAVITPVSEPMCSCSDVKATLCNQKLEAARREKDNALLLARQYRDLAENCRTEKRMQKQKLEEKIELVRNFWRNKVVEGGTRSGQILRAALIKK